MLCSCGHLFARPPLSLLSLLRVAMAAVLVTLVRRNFVDSCFSNRLVYVGEFHILGVPSMPTAIAGGILLAMIGSCQLRSHEINPVSNQPCLFVDALQERGRPTS